VLEVAQNLIDSHGLLRESGREHASTSAGRTTLDLALALHTAAPRIAAAYAAYDSSRAQALGAADCESWVEVRGRAFCDAKALRVDLERGIEEGKVERCVEAQRRKELGGRKDGSLANNSSHARIPAQPFDRVSPSLLADGPAAVLYYAPSVAALPLLEYLDEHARSFPTFQYAVRYLPTAANETEAARTPLTGYGVEMALKKTDYLVVDDRNTGDNAQKAFTAKNTAGPFAKQFGDDPWALTATPLTEDEIACTCLFALPPQPIAHILQPSASRLSVSLRAPRTR
jgi:UDP-glucose:glycoprotein glucosyltransferase